jgi:hypothetical protein
LLASAVNIHVVEGIEVSGLMPAEPDKDGFMIRVLGEEEHPAEVVLECVGEDALRCTDGVSVLVAGMTLWTREAGSLLSAILGGSLALVHARSRSTVSFYRQTITFGEEVHFSAYRGA